MGRKLIVGLGNPGAEYALTRHNIGFLVLECLADQSFFARARERCLDLPISTESKARFQSLRGNYRPGTTSGAPFRLVKEHQAEIAVMPEHNLLLARPLTYMNRSGEAVQKIMRYFKIESADLLVVHDDVSLPLGRLRLQDGGGAGGQHGIESIIAQLGGAKDFHRLKVGVGPDPGGSVRANYVLSTVPAEDRELFADSICTAAEAAVAWLSEGAKRSMNAYNGLTIGVPAALREKLERERQQREQREKEQREEKERLKKERLEQERLARERLQSAETGADESTETDTDEEARPGSEEKEPEQG